MFWCSLLPWKVSGRIISSRNYVAKDISFGVGARAAMLQGVSEVAEAVKVTMGPKVVYIFFVFVFVFRRFISSMQCKYQSQYLYWFREGM